MALVIVAQCKRYQSSLGRYLFFRRKHRVDGVGSATLEFIPGTEQAVDDSVLVDGWLPLNEHITV